MAAIPVLEAYHTARFWSPKLGTLEQHGIKHEEVLVLADGRAVYRTSGVPDVLYGSFAEARSACAEAMEGSTNLRAA